MATGFSSDDPIESKKSFENALIQLVQTAQAHGVNPAGFYESRLADGQENFEISVIELETDER